MSSNVTLYTDGACSGNPGPGGWGCVLLYGEHKRKLSGFENDTTNNKMELMAVIKGLGSLTKSVSVLIVTDSQYVKNAFTEKWLEKWLKNNWKTSAGAPVKNKELWIALWELSKQHEVSWQWVKGHGGDYYNEMCDELARNAIQARAGVDERF